MNICAFVSVLALSFSLPEGLLVQEGTASYYGTKFHGRKTSSGEIFDKTKLTAAHATLPFNTRVEITNLRNNKTVVVRINDRMHARNSKIIDISKAAAIELDMVREGIGKVIIRELPPEPQFIPLPADTVIAASENRG